MPLGNHVVYDLLGIADSLATLPGTANRRKVARRRAISTAYYAAFQAIAFAFADTVIRWSSEAAVLEPIFRSVDHRTARNRLPASTDPTLRLLGALLGRLQKKRHEADYATPAFRPTIDETADLIQTARDIVAIVEGLTKKQRKLLVALLISKAR